MTPSEKLTELLNLDASLEAREKPEAEKIHSLRSMKTEGQFNTDSKEERIAMVLAGRDVRASNDVETQLSLAQTNWEAIHEAREVLKPKIRAAKHEAATEILEKQYKPLHDKLMARLLPALVTAHQAHVELFAMARELKDREIGWRNGVCDTMPSEVLAAPTVYSPLADFFRAAVSGGYLKAIPAGFIK